MLTSLTIIFILCVALSTAYWLVLFIKLSLHKEDTKYPKNTNFSVVFCAKNELKCLVKNLKSLISQNDATQVILMDDYSTDGSSEYLAKISSNNLTLTIQIPSQNVAGKKLALTEGIVLSTNDHIVLTDGDCWPASANWASTMSSKITKQSQLVLGYGPLKTPTNLLGLFMQYETVINAIQYLSYALLNSPYMGVGRNIAFTKKLFNTVGGYSSHVHHISGDDDLLVQGAFKHTKTTISIDPETFVYSESPHNLKSYIKQKKRHHSTAPLYTLKHKILLSIHPILHLGSFITGVILIYFGNLALVVSAFVFRWVVLLCFGFVPFKKLHALKTWLSIPLCDLLLIPYYIFFSLFSFLDNKFDWK